MNVHLKCCAVAAAIAVASVVVGAANAKPVAPPPMIDADDLKEFPQDRFEAMEVVIVTFTKSVTKVRERPVFVHPSEHRLDKYNVCYCESAYTLLPHPVEEKTVTTRVTQTVGGQVISSSKATEKRLVASSKVGVSKRHSHKH